jgi:hypothetical protein
MIAGYGMPVKNNAFEAAVRSARIAELTAV